MKIPIHYNEMRDKELLLLSKKLIKELNIRLLGSRFKYKIIVNL